LRCPSSAAGPYRDQVIPATSLTLPLLGRYLLFSMVLVAVSVCLATIVLNLHYRSPADVCSAEADICSAWTRIQTLYYKGSRQRYIYLATQI
jgi:hypothetical protein